jgi:hypothetical protein
MPTIWDPAVRQQFVSRLDRLTPDATPAWGRFDASAMTAHLNDALRMATGELPVGARWLPFRYPPLRQLIVYVLPIPKSAPTAPELIARCSGADLSRERAAFAGNLEKVVAAPVLVPHPAFGHLSRAEWGVLIWKHTDHHLRQFGL